MTAFLSKEEAIEINENVIKNNSAGEMIGVKDVAMLESSIHRPKQTVFGYEAYPTVYEKATALFESIGKNHPFHNGNKRTAITCLIVFLYINDIEFRMNEDDAEDFVVDMVKHKYSFEEVRDMIEKNCVAMRDSTNEI